MRFIGRLATTATPSIFRGVDPVVIIACATDGPTHASSVAASSCSARHGFLRLWGRPSTWRNARGSGYALSCKWSKSIGESTVVNLFTGLRSRGHFSHLLMNSDVFAKACSRDVQPELKRIADSRVCALERGVASRAGSQVSGENGVQVPPPKSRSPTICSGRGARRRVTPYHFAAISLQLGSGRLPRSSDYPFAKPRDQRNFPAITFGREPLT